VFIQVLYHDLSGSGQMCLATRRCDHSNRCCYSK